MDQKQSNLLYFLKSRQSNQRFTRPTYNQQQLTCAKQEILRNSPTKIPLLTFMSRFIATKNSFPWLPHRHHSQKPLIFLITTPHIPPINLIFVTNPLPLLSNKIPASANCQLHQNKPKQKIRTYLQNDHKKITDDELPDEYFHEWFEEFYC